jgi:Flp pilus assembly protein TadG
MQRPGLASRLGRDRAATTVLEFGFVVPILLMFIFGVMEFGRLRMMQQSLAEATFAAGRYAIVHGSTSASPATAATIQTQVQSNAVMLDASGISVTTNFSGNEAPGTLVTITSTYTYTAIVTYLGLPSITLKAVSVSTILQ